MFQVNVFTIFPEAFSGPLGVSSIGKLMNVVWQLNVIDLKKFGDTSNRLDSYPCGGGNGMLLRSDIFEKAYNSLMPNSSNFRKIYFSPRGKKFTQNDFNSISKSDGITCLCGRYEGIDQRIIDHYQFEEFSIGDFVLLGGEAAAIVMIEGCIRLLNSVVGNSESIKNDSFSESLLEHDQYTKPAIWNNLEVPVVLRSGNHKAIQQWRQANSKKITLLARRDLWNQYVKVKMLQALDTQQ